MSRSTGWRVGVQRGWWSFTVVLLAAGCSLLAGDASLAGAAELKVGFVDLAKVFDGYERTKQSDAMLEKKGKQKEAELEGRMNELKKLRQGLELLNDEAREAKSREIEERSEELQRFRTAAARDLRRERDKAAKDILQEIRVGIEDYAKANSFSLILDERSLLYGQAAYDATAEMLKLLNSRATKAP
ncbi:MAG: OmpH family outer membrane protein [Candidatus Omnitrophica bacterium]|nr:OmpH family outer membrane protein [Candidatus Omnitrophota bacterium]